MQIVRGAIVRVEIKQLFERGVTHGSLDHGQSGGLGHIVQVLKEKGLGTLFKGHDFGWR